MTIDPVAVASDDATAHEDVRVLQCEDIVQEFRVRRRGLGRATVSAVAGVSLEISRGETLAIVGETGSGKSTLGRAILGVPGPKRGRIRISGIDVAGRGKPSRRDFGHLIQMIFQDPMASLDPRWPVARIVGEPLAVQHEITGVAARRRVAEMLGLVGLSASEYGLRLPRELSGGQAQRVAIARALIAAPDLIICDEPVTALDASVQAQILRLLFDLKKELKLTYLLIAHDLAVVRVLADRSATMYLGRFCEIGETPKVFDAPAHPYTAALLSAIPPRPSQLASGAPTRTRIRLKGDPPSPIDPPSGCRFRTRCEYAQDICAEVTPEMRQIVPGQSVACHFPLVAPG